MISEVESYMFYEKYTYDTDGKLLKSASEMDISASSLAVIMENREMKTAANSTINFYSDYFYEANRLVKTTHYQKENGIFKLTSFQTLAYSGNRITRVNLFDRDNKPAQFEVFEYDAAGNVSRSKHYSYALSENGQPHLVSESSFKYDNRNNPFRIFKEKGLPGLYTNLNNIIESTNTYYTATPGVPSGQIHTSTTYEYNEKRYPVKIFNASGNGNTMYRY